MRSLGGYYVAAIIVTNVIPASGALSGNPEARDALAAGSPIASAQGLGFRDDGWVDVIAASAARVSGNPEARATSGLGPDSLA